MSSDIWGTPGLLAAPPTRLTDRLHARGSLSQEPTRPCADGREEEIRPTASSVFHKTPRTPLPGKPCFAFTRPTYLSFLPLVPGATLSPSLSLVSTPQHRGQVTDHQCTRVGKPRLREWKRLSQGQAASHQLPRASHGPAGQGGNWGAVCGAVALRPLGAWASRAFCQGGVWPAGPWEEKARFSQNTLKRKRKG